MTEHGGPNHQFESEHTMLAQQLDRAVAFASKEDQIVWTIYGIFWAANAVLLVALFTSSEYSRETVGFVISSIGVVIDTIWFLIQRRALTWLRYYEELIYQLELKINISACYALSPQKNEHLADTIIGGGISVRKIMTYSGFVVGLIWLFMSGWFCSRL